MSGGTRSYEMGRRFVQKGHEVHMVTSRRDHDANEKGWTITKEAGMTVHWYTVPYSNHMGFFARVKAFLAFAYAAMKRLAHIDADVIFATSTPLTIAIPAVPASKKKRIPLVFEVRDLWPEMPIAVGALSNPLLKFLAKKLELWAYKNSQAIVALSPGMRDGVALTGYPLENIAVIPNSSDNQDFTTNRKDVDAFRERLPFASNDPVLLYAGTFGVVNGVDFLVHVAHALKQMNSNVKVLLIGDGSEKSGIIDLAKNLDVLGENCFILDAVPKKSMPAVLGSATMSAALFIDLPEMRANSANKFFDTLASGSPVLLNYGGWMNDLVISRKCGLSVWGKDYSDAATLINDRLNDDAWLSLAADNSKKLALECFDRDDLADRLIKVLEQSVANTDISPQSIAPGIYN